MVCLELIMMGCEVSVLKREERSKHFALEFNHLRRSFRDLLKFQTPPLGAKCQQNKQLSQNSKKATEMILKPLYNGR